MKKFLSIILCLLMIVPCFSFGTFAEEAEEEKLENLALTAGIKATSSWNASTLPKSAVNGASTGDIQKPGEWKGHNNYWRPSYAGRDGYVPVTPGLETFQLTFKGLNRGYKLIESVDVYARRICSNNTRYTIKALINGVWVELGSMKHNDGQKLQWNDKGTLKDYADDSSILHFDIPETVMVDGVECKVNTKTVMLELTEFGSAGCGHNWDTPIIYEIEVYGKTGFIPEIDLHDGALLSKNAALSGHRSASSSMNNQYPYLSSDNLPATFWASKATTDNEWVEVSFDKEYDLESLALNFGSIVFTEGSNETFSYKINVAVSVDGVWKDLGDYDVTTATGEANDVSIDLGANTTGVKGVKITYKQANGAQSAISEITATIADNKKCEFLYDYLTTNRKQSSANGNLAIYGEPYAFSVMDHLGISDISYINDGGISNGDYAWYAKGFEMGQYCGVTLEEVSKVNKVTLYFNDGIVGGHDARDYFVFGYDVQAKINGEFKTVASGTNYNEKKDEYIVSIEFDEVETDDIRITFTDIDIGFTYLKELEVYGSTRYEDFSTYPHGRKTVAKTATFGAPYVIGRAEYQKMANPLRSMLTIKDIKASLWI